MQVNLTGQNIDLTDPIRQYVETKFDRIRRHFDNLIDAHVVLNVEKQTHHVEATLAISGRKIFAESTDGDMYAAIDAMIDKLDRQVLKHKEKMQDHHHEVPHKNIHVG
ncbi:MAG: ribosome-associated translation inhibitor RaiA [Xanthomonadales bacterium]|nr:ribosome-associated translation inhibitor RaiA [Xanthomonadales bacterium]